MLLFGRVHSLLVFFRSFIRVFSHRGLCCLTTSTELVIACHSPPTIYLSELRQAPPSRGTSSIASTVQSDCRCLILGVSLEVPFIENITLTELGPPPSLTMCLLQNLRLISCFAMTKRLRVVNTPAIHIPRMLPACNKTSNVDYVILGL